MQKINIGDYMYVEYLGKVLEVIDVHMETIEHPHNGDEFSIIDSITMNNNGEKYTAYIGNNYQKISTKQDIEREIKNYSDGLKKYKNVLKLFK